ncbi:NAD(P)H-binding protein [Vibrio cholerae]|nr:NAD(P)H-binding protein [Vibrio cholerae]
MTTPHQASVALTGVTGALGRAVADALVAAGLPLLLLARTPARAPSLPGCAVRFADYEDVDASTAALRGMRTVFMVSASESEHRLDQHRSFVDAAAAAGVRHVVYTSFFGAAADATFTLARDHFRTEEHIRASGMTWTFLRNNFYLDLMPALVGDDGVLRGPAGVGRVAAVSRADIAAVAAVVLQRPDEHLDATYHLTGPEALSMADIAAVLSVADGRTVTFHDETLGEAYASRAPWHAPPWQVDAWVSTYTAIAAGEMCATSTDVETITGRRPQTLAEFLSPPR